MFQKDDQIRLRPDGSIDIAYYVQRGRKMRSEQAHRLIRGDGAQLPNWYRQGFWSILPRFAT